jgi:hypothetical protein
MAVMKHENDFEAKMKSNLFSKNQIQKMYDCFSNIPLFWEIDAIACRAKNRAPLMPAVLCLPN